MKKWLLIVSALLASGSVSAQVKAQSVGSDSLVLIGSNGNTTSILPGSISTSFNLTLPGNPGTNGYVLQTDGVGNLSWTSPSTSANPSGAVITFAGATCPSGYVLANGASLSQSSRSTLYAAIGTASGDGSTNPTGVTADSGCPATTGCFNAPDYRGRFLRGVDGGAGQDPDTTTRTAMAANGNTGDNVGSIEAYQVQSHHHAVWGGNNVGTFTNIVSGAKYIGGDSGATSGTYVNNSPINPTQYIQNTGGNETRPVNAYVNYCVKL